MPNTSEMRELLALVTYDERLNHVGGLDDFRRILKRDFDGSVMRFLTGEMATLEGHVKGGIAFVLAEHHLAAGNLTALQELMATNDFEVKKSVLNGLWGKPPSEYPKIGTGVVTLSLGAVNDCSPAVRAEACRVIQNQCGWGVDVSHTLDAVLTLIGDPDPEVRMQAACAVGNLAKRKYDMSQYLMPLERNLSDQVPWVRSYTAWALWQLSRYRHDISPAVARLAQLLASRDEQDDDSRKNAAGALLNHTRKSSADCQQVRSAIETAIPDTSLKVVKRFIQQLGQLA